MSLLAWIDFDEAERDRAQRILALGQERESRDELGLGAVRDAIADHLFPGTSTIQTRLRYMLFVPWALQRLEARDSSLDQLRDEDRNIEVKLGLALQAGGETTGVFGRSAGARLRRLPSDVYWAGLGNWGIRNFQGSIDSLFAALRGRSRFMRAMDADSSDDQRLPPLWHPSLPTSPKDFLETTTFRVTPEEAQFFKDRLVATNDKALLTWLAQQPMPARCQHIWMHPALAHFPKACRILVEHAEVFSALMHGAALIYNLALSELRGREDWIEEYREALAQWAADLDLAAVKAWDLEAFWAIVTHPAHSLSLPTRRFVVEWRARVLARPHDVAGDPATRQLVQTREERLKGRAQSRFLNTGARDRWRGESGAARFNFRWNRAESHLQDMADAG